MRQLTEASIICSEGVIPCSESAVVLCLLTEPLIKDVKKSYYDYISALKIFNKEKSNATRNQLQEKKRLYKLLEGNVVGNILALRVIC